MKFEVDGADAIPEPKEEAVEAEASVAEPEEKESEAESPPAEEKDLDKKTEPGFQDRLNKLTKNWRESERQVQDRDKRIAELEAKLAEAPKDPGKTLADFEYDNEKYLEYRIQKIEQDALKKTEDMLSQYQGRSEAEKNFGEFQKREAKYSSEIEDYRTVVAPENWACSEVMAGEIHRSDVGPELAYHLAKNPDRAMEISQLPERAAVKAMALLEANMQQEKAKSSKKVSDAPPPPPTIKGGDDPGIDRGYHPKMSDAEFAKKRRKEIANR